jgi:hypothetical protein
MGKKRNKCRRSAGKPEGPRLIGTPRHRLEENIKTGPIEIECGLDTSDSKQKRVAEVFEHGDELSGSIK